eukprot:15002526-Alexandrium_andersonii.AAC.1
MQMWRLMFVCTNNSCKHENDVALICACFKKPLPVLREMASFLTVWHRATVDLRMAYTNGEGRDRRMDITRYVIPEQVSRGVGPGRGLVSTATQYVVTGIDEDAPPPSK